MSSSRKEIFDALVRYGLVAACGAAAGITVYRVLRDTSEPSGASKHDPHRGRRPVRVWMDGCFDLMHFGHANAFRQGAALGDYLIVGVNPDSEIVRYKGPPIMNDAERVAAVRACRWVDEVVTGVPYVMDPAYLASVIEKYDLDFVCHGDDPCLTQDGEDVYAAAKARGKYREIKRTEGVSTTDIVGRMLDAEVSKGHHVGADDAVPRRDSALARRYSEMSESSVGKGAAEPAGVFQRVSNFLPTTMRIRQFSSGRTPKATDRIVFVPGVWDMFHAGHIALLERAASLGDFVLVGVHRDDVANSYRGGNYPIMNLHERALGVLSCRFVDEIILGCPWDVTQDLVTTFNISVVLTGGISDVADQVESDPFAVPRDLGILRQVESPSPLTTETIVARVQDSRGVFEKKFEKKAEKEAAYLKNKKYVEEL